MKFSVRVNRLLRRSGLVCRLRFGVRIPSRVIPALWDQTTPVLRDALKELVRPGMRILEMCTGQEALLLCWLAKSYPRYQLGLVGAEINPAFVDNARKVAATNGADIELINSDLFGQVCGKFGLIFVNPPYVPQSHPAAPKKIGTPLDWIWDGGLQGTDVIETFLDDARQFLTDEGLILLGVNEFYIPADTLRRLIHEKHYEIRQVVSKPKNLSRVYVLSPQAR